MKKVNLNLIVLIITLLGVLLALTVNGQSFTFTKMNTQFPLLGTQSVDVIGEIIMTDTTITQTAMGIVSTTPITKVNEYGEYKIKNGDHDIRYKFNLIPEFIKEQIKDKKGRWIVKEMEFATHILIIDYVDRFTNQHTNISIYLTPKNK